MPETTLTLTVTQAAERANVSRQYIVAEIDRGAFPNAYKIDPSIPNSPYLIPIKDFDAWMKKRGQSSRD